MPPTFVYPIRDLQAGPHDVHAPLAKPWLDTAFVDTDLTFDPDRPGSVDMALSLSGRDVVVRGVVRASVIMPCARCTKDTRIDLEGELTLLLVPGKAPQPEPKPAKGRGTAERAQQPGPTRSAGARRTKRRAGEKEVPFSAADADLDTYVGDEVVLDDFLREAILLEVPIFPLCSPQCPGIGAVPPAPVDAPLEAGDLDPRLAPLLEFQKRNSP